MIQLEVRTRHGTEDQYSYNVDQGGTAGPNLRLNGAPDPWAGCGWGSRVRLIGAINAYCCPQGPDTSAPDILSHSNSLDHS